MPAIYTHDVFGKLVYDKLEGYSKEVIAKNYNSFRIGLQGPDPLLYFRPYLKNEINQMGDSLHKQPVIRFLEKAILKLETIGTDTAAYAYLLGFLCHFTLDSECHPYVDAYAKQNGITHVFLETELDKFILKKQGMDPMKFDISVVVPTDEKSIKSLSCFYDVLNYKKAKAVLKEMKMERKLLYTPNSIRYHGLLTLFNSIPMFHDFKDLMFLKEDSEKCIESNHYLYKKMMDSVDLGCALIKEVENLFLNEGKLSARFNRDFETLKRY